MEARLTSIDPLEALRYLGHRGAPDGELLARIEALSGSLLGAAKPRLVWRRLPLRPENDELIEGQDLRSLLRESTEIVLFAATLGAEVELLLRRAQLRDMAIENVCDNFCADLAQEVAPAHLTDRFSPGYGDLPLAHQRVIFDALNVTRRIGVTLTGSGLMLPQKSVTAILGIAPTPQPRRDDRCAGCSMYDTCTRRKEGNPCEPQ